MNVTTIVVDNFLENPDLVRESAMNIKFDRPGNYPGMRSAPVDDGYRNYLQAKIENIIGKKTVDFDLAGGPRFQLCLEGDTSWVHTDDEEWSGILYLTPDAPLNSGTMILRYKDTGVFYRGPNLKDEILDNEIENWDPVTTVGNIYNRLILFKGVLYHRSMVPGFGNDVKTGRLTQVFFFSTENWR